jgi:hypothetical protein
MSKGSSTPGGVHTFGHSTKDDSGSKHPSGVGGNPNVVDKQGGSSPDVEKGFTPTASASQPKGVIRGDGTEKLRGIEVKHLQSKVKQPPTSGDTNFPSGVSEYGGKTAPRSVK